MSTQDDEFYIGYEPALPGGIGRRVVTAVVAAFVVVLVIGFLVTAAERPLAESSFAYGHIENWQGYLVRQPAPAILVPAGAGFERVWLVGRGKHGAEAVLAAVPEGWVSVRGTEIERDPWRMIEVAAAQAIAPPANVPHPPAATAESRRAFDGRAEIVDSKCFLGVMNPGERAVHRDCAIRCLSGGVTPMAVFTDSAGRQDLAVLVRPDGTVPPTDLETFVGRPVRIAGTLYTIEGAQVLQITSVSGGPS